MILRCILTGLCYNGYNEAGTLPFRAKGSAMRFEAGQGLWLFAVFGEVIRQKAEERL